MALHSKYQELNYKMYAKLRLQLCLLEATWVVILVFNCQVKNRGDRFLLFDSSIGDVNRLIMFATIGTIPLL